MQYKTNTHLVFGLRDAQMYINRPSIIPELYPYMEEYSSNNKFRLHTSSTSFSTTGVPFLKAGLTLHAQYYSSNFLNYTATKYEDTGIGSYL
jgi:hypothetical protein